MKIWRDKRILYKEEFSTKPTNYYNLEMIIANAIWIDKFVKYKNITQLSKEVIDELVDDIFIHEGKEITIKFKYEDEYQRAIDYIKRNEKITILRSEEKIG